MVKDKEPHSVERLTGADNFHTWKFAMTSLLDFSGFGDAVETDAAGACKEKCADKTRKAKALLILNVDKSLYVHISSCKTALEIWQALEKLYEDKGLWRKISLLRGMLSVRLCEADSMQAYVDAILVKANLLRGIGFDLTDEWLVAVLLASLTDEYRPMIMALEASNKVVTSDVVISKLLESGKSADVTDNAFFGGKKSGCHKCHSKTHFIADCPQVSEEERKKMKQRKSQKKPWKGGKKGGSKEGDGDAKKASAFCAFQVKGAVGAEGEKSCDWYIDSGASSHMTSNKELLLDLNKNHTGHIMVANGKAAEIKGVGRMSLKCNSSEVPVEKVLFVPDLDVNLLSISEIVKKDNTVTFDKSGCEIRDSTNRVLATIKPTHGVYKLTQERKRNVGYATMWHRKLAHMGAQTLMKMPKHVDGMKVDSSDVAAIKDCKVCAEGKQSRPPYQKSQTETTRILELLHSDVQGPMETASIGKSRYAVVIVDDYSRMHWVVTVRQKSEATQAVIDLINQLERQMEVKVKVLRTDNGGEYVNAAMKAELSKRGIVHQKTAPYCPQQNGVAERANRTLVSKAKCLLFDADLPKCYWAEAMHMAAYLVNRSLSSVHGGIP